MTIEKNLDILFKNNGLIKAKYDFTLIQNRILQQVFVNMQKEKSTEATFTLDEMKLLTGNNNNNKYINGIKEILDELMKNKVIQTKENGSWMSSYIIASHGFNKDTNIFTISLSSVFVKMILGYKESGFTTMNVTKYLELGGSNSQRLYELLRMWTGAKSKVEYTPKEIKEYLCLTNKYKEFANFRVRVIEDSIKDINKKGLMNIYKVEYIKKGRSVDKIVFYVEDLEPKSYTFEKKFKKEKIDSDGNIPIDGQIEIEDYKVDVKSDNELLADKAKLSIKTIDKLIKDNGIEKVTKAIDILLDAKNVKAPLKYLKGIIENLSKEKTNTTTSSNQNLKFSNYDQRSYDHKKVEEELMGWD
ncbi:MAG: replication initiation protein [Sarcina sp.]